LAYSTDDDATIIRNNLHRVASTFKETISPETIISRQEKYKRDLAEEQAALKKQHVLFKEEEERKARIERDKWSAYTQNRDRLLKDKRHSIIFTKVQECEYCSAPVHKVDVKIGTDGRNLLYNPNIHGIDLSQSFDDGIQDPDTNNYTQVHSCQIDPIVDKKLQALKQELADFKTEISSKYQKRPTL
jgi:hypothetical protein